MRIRLAVWTLVALLAPLAYAQEDFIPPQPLTDAGLVKYWQLQLILEKGQRLQNVFLVDDHLYLGTEDGYVFAVHAPTGLLRWLRPITRSGYPVRRPCRAGENVIFTTPSDMQIYDWATGDPVVRQDFRFPSATGPVSDGKLVFVGGLAFAAGRLTAPAAATTGRFPGGLSGPAGASFAPGTTRGLLDGGMAGADLSLQGTVESRTGTTLTLKTASGSTVTVDLSSSTTYHQQAASSASAVNPVGAGNPACR